MQKNNLVLAFLVVAVIACGSDVAARTNQTTVTPVVTPTAAPVATLDSCIDAMITAITGHSHPKSDPTGSTNHPRLAKYVAPADRSWLNDGSKAQLIALLEPCDSFR